MVVLLASLEQPLAQQLLPLPLDARNALLLRLVRKQQLAAERSGRAHRKRPPPLSLQPRRRPLARRRALPQPTMDQPPPAEHHQGGRGGEAGALGGGGATGKQHAALRLQDDSRMSLSAQGLYPARRRGPAGPRVGK